ncbi:MAG: SUMF1/EgtB/PvdO family nonheme iron enzyme [Chloroflexota bacterium]
MSRGYDNLWPRLASFANLEQAFRQAARGKRGSTNTWPKTWWRSVGCWAAGSKQLMERQTGVGCSPCQTGRVAMGAPEGVLRGGSWNNNERNLRAANRNRNAPANSNNNVGFRCVRLLSLRGRPGRMRPSLSGPEFGRPASRASH